MTISDPAPHLSSFDLSSARRAPPVVLTEAPAAVHRVALQELAWEDRGWTRGHAHIGFDDYPAHAPGRLDFGPLELAALASVDPGSGYPLHPHQNVEIVMLMLEGTFDHADTLGNEAKIPSRTLDVLSAGSGVQHSELVKGTEQARALLFWLEPSVTGTAPTHRQRPVPVFERLNRLVEVASGRRGASEHALPILRDAALYFGRLEARACVRHRLETSRRGYVVTTDAAISVNGVRLAAGERSFLSGPGIVTIEAHGTTDVALLDLD